MSFPCVSVVAGCKIEPATSRASWGEGMWGNWRAAVRGKSVIRADHMMIGMFATDQGVGVDGICTRLCEGEKG